MCYNIKMNLIILIEFVFINYILCANILVLESVPSLSHHIWINTLTSELASRGHNITSISADIEPNPPPNLHYIHLEEMYPTIQKSTEMKNLMELGNTNTFYGVFLFNNFNEIVCEGTLASKGLQAILNYPTNFKFDLVLYEYVSQSCLLGLLHRFQYPPLLALTAFGGIGTTTSLVGTPFQAYAPHFFNKEYDVSFFGRVKNYLIFLLDVVVKENRLNPKMNEMAAPYYPGSPSMSDLKKLTQLVLINTHPAFEVVEPILPSIIPVGGMQIKRAKSLPNDLKIIADSANNSLILFSLGTNMRSDQLGEEKLINILNTFRSLPNYTFLWKFESVSLPVPVPKNVYIRAWIPQVEILAHPNTILFITHGGLLSSQEAVWYGVPMLGLPVFGDQFLNIEKFIKLEIAEKVTIYNLSENEFRNGILKVIENPKYKSYRENVQKRSKNFQDQPETPLERAVFWTEWLIRNKDASFLKSPLSDFSILQRQAVDVMVFLLSVCVFIVIIILIITCWIIKYLRKNDTLKEAVKKIV